MPRSLQFTNIGYVLDQVKIKMFQPSSSCLVEYGAFRGMPRDQRFMHTRFLYHQSTWNLPEWESGETHQNRSRGNMCGNHTVLLPFSLYLFSLFGMTSIFPSLSRCDVIFRSNALDSFVLEEGWWTTLKLFTLASKKQWSNGVKHQVVDMRRSRFPSLRSIFLNPLATNVDVLQLSWQRVRPWHEGARRPEFW